MAIVGSASVVIRAITDKLAGDISNGVKKASPQVSAAGKHAGDSYRNGFNKNAMPDLPRLFRGSEPAGRHAGTKSGTMFGRMFTSSSQRIIAGGQRRVESGAGGFGGRVGNAFKGGFDRSGASHTFASIALRMAALVPILGALIAGISNLVSGLFAVASAASSAAQSLVVIPSLLGAIIQGGIVMLGSFQGVGAALSAGMKVAKDTSTKAADDIKQKAVDSGRAVRDAMENLRDAQRNAAENIKNAIRGVADAERNLDDTYRNARQARVAAIQAITDAEDAHIDALKAVRQAQEDLNDAREEAKERIIDLAFASRGGALAERQAIMDLQDARYELNATSELPVDNRIRQEAQLAYEEAQLSLDQIREKNGDIAKEQKNVKKNGIDGMDEVVSAQENLRDAQDAVRETAEAITQAYRDQKQVGVDNARAIADAQRGVRDAEQGVIDARREGARSIRDAKEALAEARKGQVEANQAIEDGTTYQQNYTKALNNLSPAAQHFVKFLISMRDELHKLRDAGAAAMFPKLEIAIQNLVDGLFPTLERVMRRTGSAVGDAAIQMSKDLTSGPFVRSFGNVTDQNAETVRRLGWVMGDLARVVVAVLDAARPLIDKFTIWFVDWADGLRVTAETSNQLGTMTDAFNKSGRRAGVFIDVIKDLIEGIYDLGSIAAPSGMSLMRTFRESTRAFADFTDTKKHRKMLREFFSDTVKNFIALSSLIKEIGGAFFRLGADPSVAKLSKALEGTVRKLEHLITTLLDQSGTSMVDFINSLLDAFAALAEGPAMKIFLGVFVTFFDTITKMMNTPVLGQFVKTLLAISAGLFAIKLISHFPGLGFLARGLKAASGAAGRFLIDYGKLLVLGGPGAFLAVAAIGALVVGLVIAYKRVKWFRDMINDAFSKIKDKVVGAFTEIKDLIMGDLVPAFKGLFDAFSGGGGIMAVLRPVVEFLFGVFLDALLGIIDGVKKVFLGVINIVSGFVKLFTAILTGDWGKAWDAVKQILGGALQAILGAIEVWFNWGILGLFKQGFKVIFRTWKGLWNFLKPIFRGIGRALREVLGAAFRIFGRVVGGVFRGIWKIIEFAWKYVIKPVFKALWWTIKNVLWPIFKFLGRGVKEIFKGIWEVIKFAWNKVIKPIWAGIKWYINNVLIPIFRFLWKNVIKPLWESIGSKIKRVWDDVIKPIFIALKDFIQDKVVPGFRSAVSRIGDIWDGLKRAAATPVNFLIGTVYNNGLRKMLNYIPGVELKEASKISFATGGIMPGYTPGRDVHHFRSPTGGQLNLSGGEAIMRPEWTRAIGPKNIERMNRAARRGGSALNRALGQSSQSFWLGGVMPLSGASTDSHGNAYPYPAYDLNYPGYADYGKPIRAWKSGIAHPFDFGSDTSYGRGQTIDHGGGQTTLYAHMSRVITRLANKAVRAGQTIGYVGDYGNTGSPPTSHLHFEIRGGRVNFGDSSGSGGRGPTLKDTGRANYKEEEGNWLSIIGDVKDAISSVRKNISVMNSRVRGNEWYGTMADGARGATNEAVQAINDKIPDKINIKYFKDLNLPNNPIPKPFDGGGLARGTGWMPKNVIAPERMLNPRETQNFERLIDILDRRGTIGGGDVKLDVHVPQDASARDVVDGIMYELHRMNQGGRYSR